MARAAHDIKFGDPAMCLAPFRRNNGLSRSSRKNEMFMHSTHIENGIHKHRTDVTHSSVSLCLDLVQGVVNVVSVAFQPFQNCITF